jgi:hypothetical protein
VGLLSAAALHGASHHAAQEFQVMVDRSVRPILVGRSKIRFFASKFTAAAAVMNIKSPTGLMRVSTPETTVVDLVRFSKSAGDLDHVATVITELSSSLEPKRLLAAVRQIGDIPNAQRLGYILEQTGARGLAEPLRTWVEHCSPKRVNLRTGSDDGREDSRWHVLVDRPLEVEA